MKNYDIIKPVVGTAMGITLALTPAAAGAKPPKAKSTVTLPADAVADKEDAARAAGKAEGEKKGHAAAYKDALKKRKDELCPTPTATTKKDKTVPKVVNRNRTRKWRRYSRNLDGCKLYAETVFKGTSKEGKAYGECMSSVERNNRVANGALISQRGVSNKYLLSRRLAIKGKRVNNRRWFGCARPTLCHAVYEAEGKKSTPADDGRLNDLIAENRRLRALDLARNVTPTNLPGEPTPTALPVEATPATSLEDKMTVDYHASAIVLTNGDNTSVGGVAGAILNFKKHFTVGLEAGYRFLTGPKSTSETKTYEERTALRLGDKVRTNTETFTEKQGAHIFTGGLTVGLRHAWKKVTAYIRGGPLLAVSEQGSAYTATNQKVEHPNGKVTNSPETSPVKMEYAADFGVSGEAGVDFSPFKNKDFKINAAVRCERLYDKTSCGPALGLKF